MSTACFGGGLARGKAEREKRDSVSCRGDSAEAFSVVPGHTAANSVKHSSWKHGEGVYPASRGW